MTIRIPVYGQLVCRERAGLVKIDTYDDCLVLCKLGIAIGIPQESYQVHEGTGSGILRMEPIFRQEQR